MVQVLCTRLGPACPRKAGGMTPDFTRYRPGCAVLKSTSVHRLTYWRVVYLGRGGPAQLSRRCRDNVPSRENLGPGERAEDTVTGRRRLANGAGLWVVWRSDGHAATAQAPPGLRAAAVGSKLTACAAPGPSHCC